MSERTENQIKAAHRALADRFYPKRFNPHSGWGSRPEFQGWKTSVCRTTEPTGECHVRNCERVAVRRVQINVHGCLGEYDVCVRHCRWFDGRPVDGAWTDGLPSVDCAWIPNGTIPYKLEKTCA